MPNEPEKLKSAEECVRQLCGVIGAPTDDTVKNESVKQWNTMKEFLEQIQLNAFKAGMRKVIKHLQTMIDDYDSEHGHTDLETGTREYPKGGDDYLLELTELQESILTLAETITEKEMI